MIRNYTFGSLDNITYVAIETYYKGKFVLCFHKLRKSWECPGGHVEAGENPLEAAKRELYEETGAIKYEIVPVWDYAYFNQSGGLINNGRVYYADVEAFGSLPEEYEMDRIGFFDEIPDNITYKRKDNMLDMLLKAKNIAESIKLNREH